METKQFFIHGSRHFDDGTPSGGIDTCCTVKVDHRHAPMPHHKAGLSFTATGYGKRIPTEYMVRFNGKWRRVYCRIFSNVGTLYIGRLAKYGERLIVQETNI